MCVRLHYNMEQQPHFRGKPEIRASILCLCVVISCSQAKLRLEMEMERQRQTHSKEVESKDEEVEEIRRSCSKKVQC